MTESHQARLGPVELTWAAVSLGGPFRSENQDAVLAVPGCFAVADGMGGYAGGALASETVVAELAQEFAALPPAADVPAVTEGDINRALTRAQRGIEEAAHGVPMGSTVTGLGLSSDDFGLHWLVWHVGDSRLYRYYRGELSQVTVDHTVVRELVLAGVLRAADVEGHPDRHVITRAVGTPDSLPADTATLEVRADEVLLLCTDGLTGTVDERLVAQTLRSFEDVGDCANRLVELAYETGGRDNASVIVVRCLDVRRTEESDGMLDAEVTRPRAPRPEASVAASAPVSAPDSPSLPAVPPSRPSTSEPVIEEVPQ